MSFEHFDRFFTFAAAGLGLLLAGGLNLALGRKGGRVWLRLVATLVVCAAVIAGLFAFTRLELAVRAAGVLFGVLTIATLAGSGWVSRQLVALATYFRKPAPRWGLVAFGGLLVLVGSGVAFDRADQASIDQQMHNLDLAVGRPPAQPSERGSATTDRGTQIVLKEPKAPRDENELAGPELQVLRDSKTHDQVIRRSGPTDHSNCHGWVFTGGKFLLAPEDVEAIVKDNGYRETHEPQPGDLVVYRQSGAIAHTAIVRYVAEGQPVLVEGKWGTMGVFLHMADKSVYGTDYTFYRSARTGHLLVGIGGSPGPATEMNTTTE
jgi:hypothetical protein